MYSRLQMEALENTRVRMDPDLCWCPVPDCRTVVQRPSPTSLLAVCPTCVTAFCFGCSAAPHSPQSCDEARATRATKEGSAAEVAFRKWAKKKTKKCPEPSCGTLVERAREAGPGDCNHMICSLCKTEFCWLCAKKVPPLGHFDATNVMGCPGLQFSGPDVKFTKRFRARARAFALQAKTGAARGAVYAGLGALVVISSPIVLVAGLPYYMYRRWYHKK